MSTGPSAIAFGVRGDPTAYSPDVRLRFGGRLVVLRPIIQRHRRQPRLEHFGVAALAGRPAYVVQDVTDWDGTVRISGEEWTARAFDQSLVVPAGATVDVIQIDGATAVVYPRESWRSPRC